MDTELTQLPGARPTLSAAQLATLPDHAPSAPWQATLRGMFWWKRPNPDARAAIHHLLPTSVGADAIPLLTLGALMSYTDTPVGPYSEVIGAVMLRRGARVFGHVPFIAVDSPASVVGGRANWFLPKTFATFHGQPANRTTATADGDDWHIEATPHAFGPPLPTWLPALATLSQAGPGGALHTVRGGGRGTMRPARIDVTADLPPYLATWLPTGRCTGTLTNHFAGDLGPAS